MDIRTPDNYKMETLVSQHVDRNNLDVDVDLDSSQDISCNELEKALLESLEESWRVNAGRNEQWEKFQSILKRLKIVGHYDTTIKKVYDLLSVLLYKYSYNIEETLSTEDYVFIIKNLQQFRMTKEDRENLETTLIRLRFSL